MLSCQVVRGRSFATKYAHSAQGSCCCVSLLLAEVGWEQTLETPRQQFNGTQTEEQESMDEPLDTSVVDEFVNLSVGKDKQNVLVAEDENEADIADEQQQQQETKQISSNPDTSTSYPAQSKRGRILAFASKAKEMAREKVKEKIEPVIKNRQRRLDQSQSSTSGTTTTTTTQQGETPASSTNSLPCEQSPQPASGIRFRGKKTTTTTASSEQNQANETLLDKVERRKEINLWEIISAQHDFNRTLWAPAHGGTFQWKTQRFNMPIKRQANFLLIGVWEKQNGEKAKPQLIGKAEIDINQIFAKTAQTVKSVF